MLIIEKLKLEKEAVKWITRDDEEIERIINEHKEMIGNQTEEEGKKTEYLYNIDKNEKEYEKHVLDTDLNAIEKARNKYYELKDKSYKHAMKESHKVYSKEIEGLFRKQKKEK